MAIREEEVTASDILAILPDLWAQTGHEEPFPEMCRQTVRGLLSCGAVLAKRA
jgi:hypothetical protein